MSASCCEHEPKFDGMSVGFKRALWAVIAINAAMFVVEMVAGGLAGSQALKADALDFAGDTATYAISLAVIGMSSRTRSLAALGKGVSLFVMGFWVLGSTVWQVFHVGAPRSEVMGAVGFLALAANLASVFLLVRYRHGDANVQSVWLCSRNDAIGNVAVMLAALGVFGTGTAWPDLAVAAIMAAVFVYGSIQIVGQALREWRHAGREVHHHGRVPAGPEDGLSPPLRQADHD